MNIIKSLDSSSEESIEGLKNKARLKELLDIGDIMFHLEVTKAILEVK